MRKHQLLRLALSIKTFLLFIFISAIHATGLAQLGKMADSLLNVLKTQTEDTNRVNTLNLLARNYWMQGDNSLAMKYANDAIAGSEKLNFSQGMFQGHHTLGLSTAGSGNEELGLKILRKALELSQQSRNKTNESRALNGIGYVLHVHGRATEALEYYKVAAKIDEDLGDKQSAVMKYYNIGAAYNGALSNYPEAIKWFTVSLKIAEETGDKDWVARNQIVIGRSYESLGNYPEALKNYLAALKTSEQSGNRGYIASSYNYIGEVYKNQGKYAEALMYYADGLKIYEQIQSIYGSSISNDYGIIICNNNIGEIYLRQGNFSEALKHHLIALKIGEERKSRLHIGNSYIHIGNVYFFQSNYTEALKNYFSVLSLYKKGGSDQDREFLAKLNTKIGETYFKMNNFSEARKHLDEALAAAKEFGGKKIIADAYGILAKTDSATGNWPQAYEAQKLVMLYRDSLLNEENSKKTVESVMQYQFDKKEDSLKYQQALTDEKLEQQQLLASQQSQSLLLKEKEVALLNNEKLLLNKEKEVRDLQLQNNATELAIQKAESEKKQDQVLILNKEYDIQTLQIKKQKQFRNYLLIGIGLLITIAAFGYFNYRTRQQLKLQKLRNKIASDLHDDVGSTLSSISMFSQMAQQQSRETIPLLDSIGDYSRKMLDAMADIVWTINPENDQFEQIILRMRNFAYDLLGTKKIEFEFDADEDVTNMRLSMDVRKNIYLIFKEATNNMAKYSGADQALFSIKNEKNNLIMLIHDNGKGFNTLQATNGNGLKNMRKRAEEMGADLRIESGSGKGTTIELSIAV